MQVHILLAQKYDLIENMITENKLKYTLSCTNPFYLEKKSISYSHPYIKYKHEVLIYHQLMIKTLLIKIKNRTFKIKKQSL